MCVPLQTLENLEAEMLNGQKLQGPPTAAEVYSVLRQRGLEDKYDSCLLFSGMIKWATNAFAVGFPIDFF